MQDATPTAATAVFKQTHDELGEYFAGERRTFTVPLRLEGTPFQQKVWEALLTIPYWEYVSSGDVALDAGLTAGHGRQVGREGGSTSGTASGGDSGWRTVKKAGVVG